MKYILTMLCGLSMCAASVAAEPVDTVERPVVEVIVTAKKIYESRDKPLVEDSEIHGLILADLSRRLGEAQKQI